MTVTRKMLETTLCGWFLGKRNAKRAMKEILNTFSTEPEGQEWTAQDIYEQSRRIISRWDSA